LGKAPNWTANELTFLEEKWGQLSIKAIAKNLGRSVEGVKIKAQRIGLTDSRLCGDGITLNQLAKALKTEYSVLKYWYLHHGFPAKPKVFAIRDQVLFVRYQDFWKWAERHRDRINCARLEPNLLGPEPEWVKEKRKFDELNFQKLPVRPWSQQDDMKLRSLVHAYRYSYTEIAERLQRTEAAVKRRLYDLGIKARPLRQPASWWTDEQVDLLETMVRQGCGYNTMAKTLGKSALAIRGKLEQMGYRFQDEQVAAK
jgi:hypothetical protein